MRILKVAMWALTGMLALLLLCIALAALFFNPNNYKAEIQRVVTDKSGRQFTLSGDLKLSVFPWLAIEMGPATLGNAPGFGERPMIAIERARLGVKVWPLLHGRFEIGDVRLDGPRIALIKNQQGIDNWSTLGGRAGETSAADDASSRGATNLSASIASLRIRDAVLSYEDLQAGSQTNVHDLSLTTGKLEFGKPFTLQSEFTLEQGDNLKLAGKIAAEITADLQAGSYRLAKPEITLRARGPNYPQQGLPIELRADLILANLKAQTASVTALSLSVSGAKFNADLQATQIQGALRATGKLSLAPVSIRDLAPQFGVTLPVTADTQVLRRLSADAAFTATKTSLELQPVTLKLDDSTLRGTLNIADFASQALRFDLAVDRIDLDRYLPPESKEESKAQTKETPPTPIPVDTVRSLNMRGNFAINEATFKNMQLSKLRVGIDAAEGKLHLSPLQAALYDGQFQGDVNLDASGKLPHLTLEEHVSGVNFAPLFKALYKTQRIAGRGSANMKLAANGADTDALKRSLSGNVDFNVENGAFEGVDLWYEIRRARAVLKQQSIPARSGPERTAFTSLRATGAVTNGVLSNKDFAAAMQYLKVTGQGSINFINESLDYGLDASVLKIPPEDRMADQAQDLSGLTIPVRVTGTLSDPKVRPDIEGYIKNKAEQKLKDKLQDKLRGLLGG